MYGFFTVVWALWFALALGGCAHECKCAAPLATPTMDDVGRERRDALLDAFSHAGLRSIEIESLGCYGTCPRYTATFRSNGEATLLNRSCNVRSVAPVAFARVRDAARYGGAVALRERYDVRAVDTLAARIVIATNTKAYASFGPDELGWGPEFRATFARLDQLVRDTTWKPANDMTGCGRASGTTH